MKILPLLILLGSCGNPFRLAQQPKAPSSQSPVINAGANLSSVCAGQPNPGLGALCADKAGVARPSTGAWDAGAYQASGAPPNPTCYAYFHYSPATVTGPGGVSMTVTHQGSSSLKVQISWVASGPTCP